ncbi:MAG TPA: PLP-dependent transferase, partial [Thermoanaerobaculia bacterium]|nr:PLP-dependent transferase [Thermoanaerobaculia bacterium]
PQDCFLILRGIKTLSLRMARHCENAQAIVAFLRGHDRVARVHYPGFGAIVSFELDATTAETIAFTRRLRLWTLAESLGSVKSLFCHPATMTHASVEPEVRRKVGIGDGLIRLSVGLEDVRDLIEDLQQALEVGRVACAG